MAGPQGPAPQPRAELRSSTWPEAPAGRDRLGLVGCAPSTPRKFFEQHVRSNYEECLHEPLNERRARNAVGDANVMAARIVHYWRDRDTSQIYGA